MKAKSMNPKEELQAIRDIMERSSKFLSLSGLSGVFAGVCALIGAAVAYSILEENNLQGLGSSSNHKIEFYLALDALLVLVIASLGAIYFSFRKAKTGGQSIWSHSSKRLFGHLLIPLITGGLFAMIMVLKNNIDLVPSITLIFYGLALVNAGKFTFGEIHYLGLTQIVLGILAGVFIPQSLLFWAFGFGIMHIVYGIVMYGRYDR